MSRGRGIVERLKPRVDAGVNYFIVYMTRVAYDPEPVRQRGRPRLNAGTTSLARV